MKQIIIATIFLSFLCSCNTSTKKKNSIESDKSTEQNNLDFISYINTLDQITLPLETNPLGQLAEISKNYNKKKFEKYKHIWTSKPLGIFYQDEKTVGIIDCSIGDWGLVPFLTTYDFKGKKIDSTAFYYNSGQDIGYEAIEYVTFNADRSITVLDTVKRWDIKEEEMDIEVGSMRMTTSKVVYRILKNGQIEKKQKASR